MGPLVRLVKDNELCGEKESAVHPAKRCSAGANVSRKAEGDNNVERIALAGIKRSTYPSKYTTVIPAFCAATPVPHAVAVQTARQGPVNCCLSYKQPGGSSLMGKAGTDRASVNFNSPYCPELALTMNRGAAVPDGSRLAANWPDLFPRELPAPLDALQTSLQAEHLLNTMNLVRRVGPSAPLYPQGQRRVCPPRSPQYTFAHAAPGWHCYGENKGVNVPDDLAGQSARPSTAPGCSSAPPPRQLQTHTTAVQTEAPRPRQRPARRARSLQTGLATSEEEGVSTSGPAENGQVSECMPSSGCEEPVQGDKRFRTFSIACGPGSPRARFNSTGPAHPDAPWVPPGRFYLDKAASDATSPQRKRALSAARLQGRQWEREAAASPLRRVPSPSQGQGGVKGSVQLRGMGSGSPQRQWGLDASSRQHLVSRRGVRPSRGTGSADFEADSAAEQEEPEAAWAGQEGLSLDQRFTQQAAASAAAAQAGRLRLRPQRWIRLPQGGARSKTLEGSGMEGVRWATARRPAMRRRLVAGSQDWQVAPTKGSPSTVRPQAGQRSSTQEQARATMLDVPEPAAQQAAKALGQQEATAASPASDAVAPPVEEPSFSSAPQEAAQLPAQMGHMTPSGSHPHRQAGGSTIVVDPAAFRRGQVQQHRQQQRSQAAARPTVVLVPPSPESDRDYRGRSPSNSPELADEAVSEEDLSFAEHTLQEGTGASQQHWQAGGTQKEGGAAAQQRPHLPRGEVQPSGASSAGLSRPVSLRASPVRQLCPESPSMQHFGASSASSSPARLPPAHRGREGAQSQGPAASSRPGRHPAAHRSRGAARGGSTLPPSRSPQRLTAEDSTDSLAELERLIEEQHRQLVAKGVLPAEPILPTDVDLSDLSLREVSMDSSLAHIEHLAGHLRGGRRHPRSVRAPAEVLGDDLLREDMPDWSRQSPRSASPGPWQPAPSGAARRKRTLLDALSSVLDAQLVSDTYSDGSLPLSGGSSAAELDGAYRSRRQEQGWRQDQHAELGGAHRCGRHHRRPQGQAHERGQDQHAELEGGHHFYDDSQQERLDQDSELAGKRHQEQQQGQDLGRKQHAPLAADASGASDPAAARKVATAPLPGTAGSAGGPAAAGGLDADHSFPGDAGMASLAGAVSSADCKAVPAVGAVQAGQKPRKAADSGAGLAEAGPSSQQQPAEALVAGELPEGEPSWEAAPSERRQVRAEASLGFGSWHSAQETGLSSGEASTGQLSDGGSGDLGPLERAVEAARALRPPAPGAARQPPHKARPGSSVIHSVFHPSGATSSAEDDQTASKAGRLGGDGASAAVDDWLLEEGSGPGSFHAGTDTEDGHATDAPQSSSWHPDDHRIGTRPVDI